MDFEKKFKILEIFALITTYLIAAPFAGFSFNLIKFSLVDFKGENKDFFNIIIFGIFGILFYIYYKIAYNLQIKFIKSEAFKNYFNLLYEKLKKNSLNQKNIENLTFENFINGMIFVELIIIVVLLIFNKEFFLDGDFSYKGNYLLGLFIVLFDFLVKKLRFYNKPFIK